MMTTNDDVPARVERRRPATLTEPSRRVRISLSRVASLAHTRVASRCVTPRVISSLGPRSRETDETDAVLPTSHEYPVVQAMEGASDLRRMSEVKLEGGHPAYESGDGVVVTLMGVVTDDRE